MKPLHHVVFSSGLGGIQWILDPESEQINDKCPT